MIRYAISLAFLLLLTLAKAERVDAIIERSNTSFHVFSEKRILESVSKRIQVISEQGDEHAWLVYFEDDFREMREYTVKVFNSSGQLVKSYAKNDFEEQLHLSNLFSYDERRVFRLDASLSSYPYTVEYAYKEKKDFAFDYSWSAFSASSTLTLHREFSLSYPLDMEVRLYFDSTEVIHTKAIDGDMVSYTFRPVSIEQRKYEPHSPPNVKGKVEMVFKTFNYNGYKGSFDSWNSFGQWMNSLWKDRDELNRSTFEAVFPEGYEMLSPKERVQTAYNYIQKNMRYVAVGYGMGGLQTMTANETYKKGYGDCKALTNFMHASLAYADIESFPALVSAGDYPETIYPDRPINSFNHVILCIPMGEDTIWTECTSNRLPVNYLSDFTDDRYVMLMTPAGGKLTRTPQYSELDNVRTRSIDVTIAKNGSAQVSFNGIYRNLAIDKSPFYLKEMAGLVDEKVMARATTIKSLDIEKIEVDLYPNDEPIMTVQAMIFNRVYAKRMGSKMLVKPFFFRDDYPVFSEEERSNPIYFRRGYTSTDSLRIFYPEGLSASSVFEPKTIDSPFGRFELTFVESEDGRSLTIIRKLVYYAGTYPPELYSDIKDFFDEMGNTKKMNLVLVP